MKYLFEDERKDVRLAFCLPVFLTFMFLAFIAIGIRCNSTPSVDSLIEKSDQQHARFEQDKKDGLIPR